MAKKKSKQKLKQAKSVTKKRKQIAAKYNLPMLSGEIARSSNGRTNNNTKKQQHQQGPSMTNHTANDENTNIQSLQQTQTPYNSPKNGVSKSIPTKNSMIMHSSVLNTSSRAKRRRMKRQLKANANNIIAMKASQNEKKDFIKEYQSLHERTLQQQWKEEQQKQKSKNRDNHKDDRPSSSFNLAEPTFDIYKKLSTDELIQQTANQLHHQQLINVNNTKSPSSSHNSLMQQQHGAMDNSTLLQQMAAKKREEMKMEEMYSIQKENSSNLDEDQKYKNNSFWAFQDDSDDDDQEQKRNGNNDTTQLNKQHALVSPFQFAAPAFSVPDYGQAIQGHGNNSNHAVDDPDL